MKIFVFEKDRQFRELIGRCLLENTTHEVQSFDNTDPLETKLDENPDLVVINGSETDGQSFQAINLIRTKSPKTQVLFICQPELSSIGARMLELGIYDYINTGKGFKEKFLKVIQNITALTELQKEVKNLKSHISRRYDISNAIIGESKGIKKALALIEKAISVQNITVSIHGESGTGKELVARTIHFNSARKEYPFITVNMGAIPQEFFESELFGHEMGALPGAYTRSVGKIEEADQGTLFINEIAELDLNTQFKLFQAIQEKSIRRAGSNKNINIDTRIIAATTRDLTDEVAKGRFREDLYYRLLSLPIVLPPLSERENDVILLANHFLKVFCQENKIEKKAFSPEAREKLMSHNYPGNVRELNAIVELAAILSNDHIIDDEDIMFSPTHANLDIFNTEMPLREFEIKIIRHFLERYNNNVVLVAKKLEIGKSKIYNMIKKGEL